MTLLLSNSAPSRSCNGLFALRENPLSKPRVSVSPQGQKSNERPLPYQEGDLGQWEELTPLRRLPKKHPRYAKLVAPFLRRHYFL